MRAALYARVSSKKQSIASQLPVLHGFAARMQWSVVGVYIDEARTAKSGHLDKRKDWQRLQRDMTAGAVDVVAVVEQDRVTRAEDLAERGAMLGALQKAGVKLANATTGQVLDLGTSTGDLIASLQGFFAADWLRKHRDRIVAGKASAIARGRKPAGPTPYGLRYDRATGAWSLDPTDAEVVREIYRRVAAGESTMAIANDLQLRCVRPLGRAKLWERAAAYRIARSTTYRGEWRADKRKGLSITVPRIVDDELWHAAQQAFLDHGKRGLARTKHIYLLQGLAVCELCGGAIRIQSATGPRWSSRNTRIGGTPARYACINTQRAPAGGERCALPYLLVADVDARLWTRIGELLRPDQLQRGQRRAAELARDGVAWESDLQAARGALARLERAEEAVLARFRRGLVSEAALDRELAAIKRERDAHGRQVAAATKARQRAGAAQERARSVQGVAADLGARLAATDLRARRELVELLLEPGAVVLGPTRIYAKGQVSLGAASGYSSHAGAILSFRLVG
jgi:site-specific DNA recombinase